MPDTELYYQFPFKTDAARGSFYPATHVQLVIKHTKLIFRYVCWFVSNGVPYLDPHLGCIL